MDLQPVEAPQSLVDVITRRIEQAIFSGVLEPGAKVSELGLAQQLGSLAAGRCARRFGGSKDASSSSERPTSARGSPNCRSTISKICGAIREALEGMAARLAASNMTDADVVRLRRLIEQHGRQESVRTGTGYLQEVPDFDFHFFIIRTARNERLEAMLCGELYDLLRAYRYKSSTLDGRARNAFEEHQEISSALIARDPDSGRKPPCVIISQPPARTSSRRCAPSGRDPASIAERQGLAPQVAGCPGQWLDTFAIL